jgi:hypothetical protein
MKRILGLLILILGFAATAYSQSIIITYKNSTTTLGQVAGGTTVIKCDGTSVTCTFTAGVFTITAAAGAGTVTGCSFTGGLISCSGSTTTASTVAGTSGGIPYFSGTSTWASSALLTQYGVLFGGGTGGSPTVSAQGASNMPLIGQGAANPIFSTIAYPTSLTSGGVLYASTTTAISGGGILNTNILTKGGGAGAAPTNSLITENGTTAAYTGTGGYVAPLVTTNGSNSGFWQCTQGTAQGHATANTFTFECPAAVTAYEVLVPGAAATGLLHWSNSSGVVTESISAVADGDLTGQVGVAHGGTALGTLTTHALYVGNGTSAPNAVGLGTTTTVLHGAVAGDPTFGAIVAADITNNTITGTQLASSLALTTPNVTTILDANAKAFIASSATASAVDSITVTNAATANPATVTVASSGSDSNVNLALNAKGTGTVQASTFLQSTSNRVFMTADWTCGTGGTVSSCATAVIIGSGGGTALTITLPLQAQSWQYECNLVVGQATGATANNWNLITSSNAPTNITAYYQQGDSVTTFAGGATTGTSSTTTFNIGGAWTLGGTATKMPVHIWGMIGGASASGTVVSLQLVAPTVADLVTIYQGGGCRVY